MKKMIFAYYLMVIMAFSTTAILTAESMDFNAGSINVAGNEEESSIVESRDFDGDYFWGGYRIDFRGLADDLYLMGRNIEFEGLSEGTLTAFGDSIKIDGQVGNNLHSAGNDVRITGTISDTAFVAGQDITVTDNAVVEGTLISGSSTLHIMGELRNGLLAGAGEIIIDGPVNGDVNVRTGKLIITERGSIRGNLTYGSNSLLSQEEKARVSGTVKFEENKEIDTEKFSTFKFFACLLFFAGMAVTGFLILLLPVFKEIMAGERDFRSCGKTALWGLIPLFIYPVAVVVTIPLFPLSIGLALAAFPLWMLTIIVGLALAGRMLFRVFKWENQNRFLYFLLAFGIYVILSMVPYLGFLVGLAITALGSGQLIRSTFNTEW
ncbi:bactofilin family protein [Spirochaeta isovalerica]|uniref:Cytoskeletal protein CcmA (Bactofilin family) n=1 Tax=Spirochaeta isovalerica TaxID=150 RepID=A0A841RAI6_9SPIO|nr:polymer-forming cytoskeletal protein [Spirochaeta isovalerica]MBB6480945.1 cytoskeletal protein CcmA (bactofilin family) [Spirochaeta isovalerica]